MASVRVAVNGYGVIGKRVADAVGLQPDMTLVGVADVAADYRVAIAAQRGFHLFGSTPTLSERCTPPASARRATSRTSSPRPTSWLTPLPSTSARQQAPL